MKNNNSLKFEDWTTQKLKKATLELNESIFVIECYGINDLQNLRKIEKELHRRGWGTDVIKDKLTFIKL